MRFAPSDSPWVAEVLTRHGFSSLDAKLGPDSIVVVSDVGGATERIRIRSEAVLALLAELPQPWPTMAAVARWIPLLARESAYRLIARWRHRIGRRLEVKSLWPTRRLKKNHEWLLAAFALVNLYQHRKRLIRQLVPLWA